MYFILGPFCVNVAVAAAMSMQGPFVLVVHVSFYLY